MTVYGLKKKKENCYYLEKCVFSTKQESFY